MIVLCETVPHGPTQGIGPYDVWLPFFTVPFASSSEIIFFPGQLLIHPHERGYAVGLGEALDRKAVGTYSSSSAKQPRRTHIHDPENAHRA